jgi:hypothetical protein
MRPTKDCLKGWRGEVAKKIIWGSEFDQSILYAWICIYGNITTKPLCTINHANKIFNSSNVVRILRFILDL